MTVLRNNNGFALLNATLILGVLVSALYLYSTSINAARKQANQSRDALLAESYASELIELFSSLNRDQWVAYMQTNLSGSSIRFCDNITSDPVASLPSMPTSPTRSYRIELVDKVTLVNNTAVCGSTYGVQPIDFKVYGFYITVTVAWFSASETNPIEKRVTLAAFIGA